MVAKPPEAPPPLVDLGALKAKWEAAREEHFPVWKALLEAHGGNVTRAARAHFLSDDPSADEHSAAERKRAKYRGHAWTRALGLVAYASELRVAAQGSSRGRPWPKTKTGRSKRP